MNSAFSGGYTDNLDYTLYMVLSKGGQYTKHIYIGTQRIASKLGDVGSFGVDPRREEYAGSEVSGTEMPDYASKYKALQEVQKAIKEGKAEKIGESKENIINIPEIRQKD